MIKLGVFNKETRVIYIIHGWNATGRIVNCHPNTLRNRMRHSSYYEDNSFIITTNCEVVISSQGGLRTHSFGS